MRSKKYVLGLFAVILILFQTGYSASQNNTPQTAQNTEEKILDYVSLIFTGGVPFIMFVWWLINSQQDKKRLEQSQEQNDFIDVKLRELLKNQQQNCIGHQAQFNELISRVEDKIDLLSAQFSEEKYTTLKKYYDHEAKITELIKDLSRNKNLIDNVKEIENYLSLRHDYKVRTYKKEKEVE